MSCITSDGAKIQKKSRMCKTFEHFFRMYATNILSGIVILKNKQLTKLLRHQL